jgi:hypothetical protein
VLGAASDEVLSDALKKKGVKREVKILSAIYRCPATALMKRKLKRQQHALCSAGFELNIPLIRKGMKPIRLFVDMWFQCSTRRRVKPHGKASLTRACATQTDKEGTESPTFEWTREVRAQRDPDEGESETTTGTQRIAISVLGTILMKKGMKRLSPHFMGNLCRAHPDSGEDRAETSVSQVLAVP